MCPMPTRRIMLLTGVTFILLVPAVGVVKTWGRRQLAVNPEGSIMHGVGEVLVAVLP